MRKAIMAAAVAVAVAAAGLVIAARPTAAALGDVPADCSASTVAYRSDGQRLAYRYAGRKTSTEALRGDMLGWMPTALTGFGSSGGSEWWESFDLVTHPTDGNLYLIKRHGERVDGTWRITLHDVTRVASGFAGTRDLTMAWPYVYRVAGTSLYRFKFSFVDGRPTISAQVRLSGTGWDQVNTLSHQRTTGTGTAAVDTLLGTTSTGQLKEWQVTYASPAKLTPKVLKTMGWAPFTSLSTGYCTSRPAGRALLGITAAGRASIHFDANRTDGDGTDIKGGSLGLLGWTEKSY